MIAYSFFDIFFKINLFEIFREYANLLSCPSRNNVKELG